MIKLKIKKDMVLYIWSFFLAVSISIRCLPTLIYRIAILEYIVIIGISLASVLIFISDLNMNKLLICDFFWLLIPFFFISKNINLKYIFFVVISLIYYFLLQKNIQVISSIKYPLLFFSILTSIITWISFFFPLFYKNKILTLFPEKTSLIFSFTNRNMYHGFTNHYSRNSFYIVIGILLVFSDLLSRQKKNKKNSVILLFFFFCTQLLVAKRGLTIFLVLTLLFIVFLKESNSFRKILNSLKFFSLGLVLFILVYFFVPGVDNIIARIISPNSSNDISSGRFYLYSIAINMFLKNPIIGNGWGSFLEIMKGTTYQGVHNDYLQLLGEVGIGGFSIFVIANFTSLYYTYKSFKVIRTNEYDSEWQQKWLIFSFSYQIFFLLYSLTGLPHYSYEQFALYIMVCGIGIGMYKYPITNGGNKK